LPRAAGRGVRAIGNGAGLALVPPALLAAEKLFLRKRSRFLELIGSLDVAASADYKISMYR